MAIDTKTVRNSGTVPLDEWLEAVAEAAADWRIESSQVPPCLAVIWRDGVSSERNPTAFNVALWLRHAGKDQVEVQELIRQWSTRLSRPLPAGEISKVARNAFKDRYIRPPSCRHEVLRATCVGEDCHTFKAGALWRSAPVTPNGAMAQGLMAVLSAREWLAFCAIFELAKRKGRRPGSEIRFTYREIERVGGIPHQHQGKLWRRLEASGMIKDFKPSPPQPDKKRGRTVSSCRLPACLPTPQEVSARRFKMKWGERRLS